MQNKTVKDKWSDKPSMEVRDLHFAYGRNKVLKGVSLKIEEGKITTIMGANGCGKSTLFSLMTKNLYPRKGNIFLKGKNILNLKQRRKMISGKLLRPSDESQIDFFLIQKLQRLISRLAGNCDTYMRKTCNIVFQVGEQYISGKSRTGAQTQLWNVPGTVMANGIFSFIQK